MKNLKTFESFYKQHINRKKELLLTEAAKKVSDLVANPNIALYIKKEENQGSGKTEIEFFFYDISKLESVMKEDPDPIINQKDYSVDSEGNIFTHKLKRSKIPEGIIGYISIKRATKIETNNIQNKRKEYTIEPVPFNCFKVGRSVINKEFYDGYGPALYDTVISYTGKNGLRPSDDLSDDSKRVWNYYLDNRTDIRKEPIDPIGLEEPLSVDKEDDGMTYSPLSKTDPTQYPKTLQDSTFINHVYFYDGHSEYLKLIKNHDDAKSKMNSEQKDKLENYISTWCNILFNQAYHPRNYAD